MPPLRSVFGRHPRLGQNAGKLARFIQKTIKLPSLWCSFALRNLQPTDDLVSFLESDGELRQKLIVGARYAGSAIVDGR